MEIYKLIATVKNTAPDTVFTFAYLPENFEGVKITQSFSFVNPIGYTPKFSIETMKIIASDKTSIDAVFLQYGMESEVEILIQELKSDASGYDNISTFAIDFETYDIQDFYSEFALKSISDIDKYNNEKNTEKQFSLTSTSNALPTTQKYINYVSLKSKSFQEADAVPAIVFFQFDKNNESKVYNLDTAIYTPISPDGNTVEDADIYRFGGNTSNGNNIIKISCSGKIKVTATFNPIYTATVTIRLYRNDLSDSLYNIKEVTIVNGINEIDLNIPTIGIESGFLENDVLFIMSITTVTGAFTVSYSAIDFFVDIKRKTAISVLNESVANTIKYLPIADVLSSFFPNVSYPFSETIFDYGLTSASSIMKLNDFANVKPKEFLSDLCAMAGLICNFKTDGGVELARIDNYFNDLLNVANAETIDDYKELSIKYNQSINFASVSTGQQNREYDIYTYFEDWNKVLTFKQENRNATENLDLSLQKFRTDFSGILDYFYKRSQQSQKPSKDNFIFRPIFYSRSGTSGENNILDFHTPRDILTNWKKFLSFCFQNFDKDTLVISANGDTVDNALIESVNQMDNLVLNESPKLLPIEYSFTCLLPDIDFSEKILKINHNDVDVYLFVINAETTDKLSEQKVTCLKIEF